MRRFFEPDFIKALSETHNGYSNHTFTPNTLLPRGIPLEKMVAVHHRLVVGAAALCARHPSPRLQVNPDSVRRIGGPPMFVLMWFSKVPFVYEAPYGGAAQAPAGRSVLRFSTKAQALALGRNLAKVQADVSYSVYRLRDGEMRLENSFPKAVNAEGARIKFRRRTVCPARSHSTPFCTCQASERTNIRLARENSLRRAGLTTVRSLASAAWATTFGASCLSATLGGRSTTRGAASARSSSSVVASRSSTIMATKSTWEAIIRRWRKTSTTDLGGGLERYRMHRNKKAQVREILPALLPENNQTLGKNMSICTKNIPRRIGDRALCAHNRKRGHKSATRNLPYYGETSHKKMRRCMYRPAM